MDYEVERLVFVVRSVADGVDKGFKAAERAASGMADVYAKAEKTERTLERALQKLRQELEQVQKAGQKDTSVIEGKIARLEQSKKSLQSYVEGKKKRTEAILEAARAEAESAKQQQESQAQMLAAIAIIGVIIKSYKTLVSVLDETTTAYAQNRNAMVGLRSIAEGTGQDMGSINKAIGELIDDGLIPLEQASTSVKNLLSRGFEAQEAIDIILRLKDAAAFGRQASYSLADAVMTATEGLKNENSILVDNAGVTKNVSKMWQDYAKQRGITTEAMTLAQKREAEYIGIMEETRHQVGDAKKLSEEFAGSQLALEASTQRLKVAIGEANVTGLTPMLSLLNQLTRGAADFATENQGIITFGVNFGKTLLIGGAALLLFRTNFKGVIADMVSASPILGKITAQFGALKGVISGPWGWITLGISVLVGVLTAVAGESAKATEKLRELNEEASELSRQAHGATSLVDRYEELSANAFRTKEETAEMNRISIQLVTSYGFRADGINAEGEAILTNVELMREQLRLSQEMAKLKLEEAEKGNENRYEELLDTIDKTNAKLADEEARLGEVTDALRKLRAEQEAYSEAVDKERIQPDIDLHVSAFEEMESNINKYQQKITTSMQELFELVGQSINLAKARLGSEASEIPQEMFSAIAERMQQIANEGGDISADAAEAMMRSFLRIDKAAAVAEGIAELTDVRTQIIAGVAASGIDDADGISIVDQIMESLTSDSSLSDTMAKAKVLGQRIMDGVASADEKKAFNTLSGKMLTGLSGLQKDLENKFKSMRLPTDSLDKAFDSLRGTLSKTAADLEKFRGAIKAPELKDLIGMLGSAQSAYESLNKEIQDAYDLQAAIDVLREGDTATREFAQALEFMTDRYGVSKDQILENLDAYQSDVDAKNVMIEMNYALAQAQILMAINSLQSMKSMDENVNKHSKNVINSLQKILDKLAQLDGASATISTDDDKFRIDVNRPGGGGRKPSWLKPAKPKRSGGAKRSSKAQSDKNVALERELALIERKKRLDQITFDEEISLLERARRLYAKTAEERAKIDDQVYALRREKETAHIEHLKAMNRLTLAEEIKMLEKRLASYKAGTEGYKEVERQLHQARQEEVRRAYDTDVYYGKLTLEQQAERLREMISQYRKGTEARIELEKELFDLQQQIKERDQELTRKAYDLDVFYGRLTLEQQAQRVQEMIRQHKEGTDARIELEKELFNIQQQIKDRDKEMELARFEHAKAMNQLTLADEIKTLEKRLAAHKAGTAEYMEIERELYQLRQNQQRQTYDLDVFYGRLTLEQQAERIKQMVEAHKKGTEARIELEKELFSLQQQIIDHNNAKARQAYDLDVFYGRLTLEQQVERVQEMVHQYKRGTNARIELEKELFNLQQQIKDRDRALELARFEHLRALNQLTLKEEIQFFERRLTQHEIGSKEYLEIDRQLYQLRQEQVKRAYEIDVYYGRLTLEQQRERIKAMIQQHKEGTKARIELEKQLYDTQKRIKDRDTQSLQKLADGVLTALRARYEAQRQAEQEHIQQSMDNWSEWSRAQREAIEEQIKALDELTKGEDRAEEERKRRRKIAALEQQLQYENDAYNRRKLQEQIAKEQEELNKWLARNEREDAKELLRDQANEIAKRAEEEQKLLQQQLDNLDKFYEDRLKEHKLIAEAEQLILTGNQKDILNLIRSFAPAYDAVGKSLGEQLYEGFASKAMDINTWFETMTSQIESYQLKMAREANKAAIAFWQTHGIPTPATAPKDPGGPEITLPPIVINYYSERESPATLSREIERMLERMTRR